MHEDEQYQMEEGRMGSSSIPFSLHEGNNEESQPVCVDGKNGGMGEWSCLPPCPREARVRWWSVHVGKG